MAIRAKAKTKLELQEPQRGLLLRDAKRESYLLTFYTPRQGESVVLLQASQTNKSLSFPDLESTFKFLKHQTQKDKRLEDP